MQVDVGGDKAAVLVVGGSLVGLSTAVFLAWHGVPTVLCERHAQSSPHPRAIGYTPRTLELLRSVGLGARIPQVPPDFKLRRTRVESLAGKWFEETLWTPPSPQPLRRECSPCTGAALAQDRLEPILRDKAAELGADLRFATELVSFTQDEDGVTATLRQRDGRLSTLRAAYLVAADGNQSPVRTALEIGRSGRGHLRTMRSVLFRAPLEEYLKSGISQFAISQPDLEAFLTTYGDGRWALMFSAGEEPQPETLRAMIYKAIGRSDLPLELITTGCWELCALIAERFSSGRVFLAGDAAHTLPPSRGGYGANTGIEDAHNLAWKLAAVLAGTAMPSLLDTYDAERRPIAWLRHQQIFARPDYKPAADSGAGDSASAVEVIDDDAMELGQLYRSSAVLGASAALPPALRPEQWAGQPGTRAPHAWVLHAGQRLSTLDLFHKSWVLLAADSRWGLWAAQTAERLGIALCCWCIGVDITPCEPDALAPAFGLGPTGAALIRPDGYIAWRSCDLPEDAPGVLGSVLASILGKSGAPPLASRRDP